MLTLLRLNRDLREVQEKITTPFAALNTSDPAQWPFLPRILLSIAWCAAVVAALWFFWLSSVSETLIAVQAREVQLKHDFHRKVTQTMDLGALSKQRDQVQQYVNQLERQLPTKAEMDALLSDINQAGMDRHLQFELFRPGQVTVNEFHAELPIAVRVTGAYHGIGLFVADMAHLPRIVTLNNLSITPVKDQPGLLTLDGTVKTFRYLDQDELALQQKAKEAGK